MKKQFMTLWIVLLCIAVSYANPCYDPQDNFYTYVQSWQSRGLIDSVPSLRPYPLANIKDILQSVIERGDEKDVEFAQNIYEELTGKIWNIKNSSTYKINADAYDFNDLKSDRISLEGNFGVKNDCISMGYDIGFLFRSASSESSFLPYYTTSDNNITFDSASIGSFYSYFTGSTMFSAGSKKIFLQTGISRNGYGTFLNRGIVLSDSAISKPSFSISYAGEKINYTQWLGLLGASRADGEKSVWTYGKVMNMHAVDYTPIRQLTLSAYEVALYGQRFDASYLIPAPYMLTQAFTGYGDDGVNLLMGFGARVNPLSGLVIASDVLVDDVNVNELAKLNFNTKIQMAWDTGVIYYPSSSVVESISLDYLIVTTYMYTHRDSSSTYSYQNYTNCGYSIANEYPPNSDTVNFKITISPVEKLDLTFTGMFLRHGNICESYSDAEALSYLTLTSSDGYYSTDGGFYTAYRSGNFDYSLNTLNFLTQEHKMYVVQAGVKADYELKKYKWGKLKFNISYVFEYIHNKGVDSSLYPAGSVTENSGVYTYDGGTTSNISDVVSYYKNRWVSGLYDDFNNFVTIGLTYTF